MIAGVVVGLAIAPGADQGLELFADNAMLGEGPSDSLAHDALGASVRLGDGIELRATLMGDGQAAAEAGLREPPEFLSTHPVTEARLEQLSAVIRRNGWPAEGTRTPVPTVVIESVKSKR